MQNIEEIYTEYFNTVYKYLLCLTRDSNISEELTQETFYIAVKKINTFKGGSKISVWLCQIAKNLWYNEINKRKKNVPLDEIDEDEIHEYQRFEIEDDLINQEEKLSLYKRINKLDSQTKEIIYLRLTR